MGKQISLPLKDAIKISFNGIRMRAGRSSITTAGILLGIAFLVSMLVSSALTTSLSLEPDPDMKVKQLWLVTISLLVSVLGIANAMLMSVTERYKEIGTMKCLGALNKFIIELFILEALFQGLLGSLLGCIVGTISMTAVFVFTKGMKVFLNYPILPVLLYNIGAVLIGVVLAIIGAIYPAIKAAKMEPVEAMRAEV
ncbi:MAG: hypothetical protein A2452_10085 [Candidatus Firestonebacteria bacterium RIFOXYC2_FULL_39_67]|nr:MAG: hypothetical protein A2536_04530 [Candidatus Firestonebacteria bacterium RIFOXYD2_FULL_39_29]OGF56726.1 MAG: hypothetical protein A2497_07875 [Candidatus Firestonebacteria bacterium RifOxyC12_full_39_7]OGF57375.1 MAG: hypothetical protein A2452_10085 [Candidatus Firestonebacteria bacterium RIFOXYC2_FULL_39_67]